MRHTPTTSNTSLEGHIVYPSFLRPLCHWLTLSFVGQHLGISSVAILLLSRSPSQVARDIALLIVDTVQRKRFVGALWNFRDKDIKIKPRRVESNTSAPIVFKSRASGSRASLHDIVVDAVNLGSAFFSLVSMRVIHSEWITNKGQYCQGSF